MERELFARVYRLLVWLGNGKTPAGCQYTDATILAVWFWAVIHDRPMAWACNPTHGLAEVCCWQDLPSVSTVSRRLRSWSCGQLLKILEAALRPAVHSSVRLMDARPLVIGWHSKDRDCRIGRAAGPMAKGYKFYAIWDLSGHLQAWALWPMNVGEVPVAMDLIGQVRGPGWLLADKEYDCNALYERADAQDLRLLTPKIRGQSLGRRRHSPHRLISLSLLGCEGGQMLLRQRMRVESFFGQQSSWGGGLTPLPAWVRRWRRVCLWVQAKVILDSLRRRQNKGLVA